MSQLFPKPLILCLSAYLVGCLWIASSPAQPPGKGKGPRRRPGPAPGAELMTVRGTVREVTTAPKGEVDGLILNDGTWVHWPPHLQGRFKDIAGKGDRVRATGYWETGPAGDTKLEVSALTNLGTDQTATNPDRPPPAAARVGAGPGPRAGEARTVRGKVERFTTAPRGEVDGAMLDDGTWLHWPPHMQNRFSVILKVGDRVRATGRTETGPKGDTHFEVERVTNLRTDEAAENPDFADGPPPPPRGGPRVAPRPAANREQRLRDLEDQVQQLQREIQRLRRER